MFLLCMLTWLLVWFGAGWGGWFGGLFWFAVCVWCLDCFRLLVFDGSWFVTVC